MILWYIIAPIMWLLSQLPLRVLFFISDLLYPLVYYVVKYRKQVVRQNLLNAFPEKDIESIINIEKAFYRHFIDLIVEAIKMASIKESQVPKYIRIKNPELLKDLNDKKISAVAGMGHYGNWEWLGMIQVYSTGHQNLSLYKPLHNRAIDKLMNDLRSRFGTMMVPMQNALRQIINLRNEGKVCFSCFIADQSPMKRDINYCSLFLNQPTPVFSGLEKIARHNKQAVMFLSINKLKRGFYEVEFHLIALNPSEFSEFEVTENYTKLLENQIRKAPQYWLWTHKRWKHSQHISNNASKYHLSESLRNYLLTTNKT